MSDSAESPWDAVMAPPSPSLSSSLRCVLLGARSLQRDARLGTNGSVVAKQTDSPAAAWVYISPHRAAHARSARSGANTSLPPPVRPRPPRPAPSSSSAPQRSAAHSASPSRPSDAMAVRAAACASAGHAEPPSHTAPAWAHQSGRWWPHEHDNSTSSVSWPRSMHARSLNCPLR